jgi:hypothetical protein
MRPEVSSKALGDAGEYFALSQFTFAGLPASKMPDCWPGYDLIVESGHGLARVSVKTRRETINWKSAAWFMFDERIKCDWIVFLFLPMDGHIRSWILPFEVARELGNKPLSTRKDPHNRDMSFAKLNRESLLCYENNWSLVRFNLPSIFPAT